MGQGLYSGGVSWTKPVVDVSSYLIDGANEIVIEYNSALSNVQLDRGIITEMTPVSGSRGAWWGMDQVYLEFGSKQAKIVAFIDVHYTNALDQLNGLEANRRSRARQCWNRCTSPPGR